TRFQEQQGVAKENDFSALADVASRSRDLEVALAAWQRLQQAALPSDGDPLAQILEVRQHLQSMIARISQPDRRARLTAAVDESLPRLWQKQLEIARTPRALDE